MATGTIKKTLPPLRIQYAIGTVPDNTEATADISAEIPAGYKLFAVLPRYNSGGMADLLSVESNTTFKYRYRLLSGSAMTSVSVYLILIAV